MYSQVAQTYQKTQQTTANPRELEAALLIKAAARLQNVVDAWGATQNQLDPALSFNRKLWTILSTSATDASHPLPAEVKTNIANLALFIFQRTIDILSDPRPEKLGVLISINANVAAGLRGSDP